jgi:hypothetical protein
MIEIRTKFIVILKMNKYIKTDIEQGIQYLKIGIMNALENLESGKEKGIRFETDLPLRLIIKCAEERGWEEDMKDWNWTNGWQIDYCYYMKFPNKNIRLMISGSLLEGNTKLIIDD